MRQLLRTFALLAAAALPALPAVAAGGAIYGGIDTWITTEGTYFNFDREPLPAGFFCPGSEPFTGRIDLLGVPVATGKPGELGRTDTIVQRLDDAVFNKRGVATTRIQIKALSLQSVKPIETACGSFVATVSLNGPQPVTTMRIIRDNPRGGRYIAPVGVAAKVTFRSLSDPTAAPLVVQRQMQFLSPLRTSWTLRDGRQDAANLVLIDTDGDGRAETYLPRTGNFAPGRSSVGTKILYEQQVCHDELDGSHCQAAY